jgi:hypothetical protein
MGQKDSDSKGFKALVERHLFPLALLASYLTVILNAVEGITKFGPLLHEHAFVNLTVAYAAGLVLSWRLRRRLEGLCLDSKDRAGNSSSDSDAYAQVGGASVRKVGAALLVVGLVLSWPQTATAQKEPGGVEGRNAELEVQKLKLEVEKLKLEVAQLKEKHVEHWWLTGLLGLLTGVAGTATSFWLAHRARLGEMDQAVHEKRLEFYPLIVKAASRLALYFPGDDPSGKASVGPDECRAMGRAMSEWYFGSGGLLLSVKARDAYFKLARALTRASLATALKVPKFPDDAEDISTGLLMLFWWRLPLWSSVA